MTKDRALSDVSRVEWQLNERVVLLEIDGLEGWHLPTSIDVSFFEVRIAWALIAEQPLDLLDYRLWFGDRWFNFRASPIHVAKGYEYRIDVTMKRNR